MQAETATRAVRREIDENGPRIDSGCHCLVLLARYLQVAADPEAIKHQFDRTQKHFDDEDLLRAAKYIKLKAKKIKIDFAELTKVNLPVIVKTAIGGYEIVLALQIDKQKVVLQTVDSRQPVSLDIEAFVERWTGEIILVSKRSLIPGVSGKFDISWFIPAILKYKKLLFDVLVASFFIQLFALVTPLFFQVIIDKVLVHRGLTTLLMFWQLACWRFHFLTSFLMACVPICFPTPHNVSMWVWVLIYLAICCTCRLPTFKADKWALRWLALENSRLFAIL